MTEFARDRHVKLCGNRPIFKQPVGVIVKLWNFHFLFLQTNTISLLVSRDYEKRRHRDCGCLFVHSFEPLFGRSLSLYSVEKTVGFNKGTMM